MQPIVTKAGLIQNYFMRYQQHLSQLTPEQVSAIRQDLSRLTPDDLARDDAFFAILFSRAGIKIAESAAPPSNQHAGRHAARHQAQRGDTHKQEAQRRPPLSKEVASVEDADAAARKIVKKVLRELSSVALGQLPKATRGSAYVLDQATAITVDLSPLVQLLLDVEGLETKVLDEIMLDKIGAELGARRAGEGISADLRRQLEQRAQAQIVARVGYAADQYHKRYPLLEQLLNDMFGQASAHFSGAQMDYLSRIALLAAFLRLYRDALVRFFATEDDGQAADLIAKIGKDERFIHDVLGTAMHDQEFYYRDLSKFQDVKLLAGTRPLLAVDISSAALLKVEMDTALKDVYTDEKAQVLTDLSEIFKGHEQDEKAAAADNQLALLDPLIDRFKEIGVLLKERLTQPEARMNRKTHAALKKIVNNHYQNKEQALTRFYRRLAQCLDEMASPRSAGPGVRREIALHEEHRGFGLAIPINNLAVKLTHRLVVDMQSFLPVQTYGDYVEAWFQAHADEPLQPVSTWIELSRSRYNSEQQRGMEDAYAGMIGSFVDFIGSFKGTATETLGRHLGDTVLAKIRADAQTGVAEVSLTDFMSRLISSVRLYLKKWVEQLPPPHDGKFVKVTSFEISSKLRIMVNLLYEHMSENAPLLYVPLRVNISVKDAVSFEHTKTSELTAQKLGRILAAISEIVKGDRGGNTANLIAMAVDKTSDYFETDRFLAAVVHHFGGDQKPSREPLFPFKANYDSRYVVLDQDNAIHRKYQKVLDQLKAESVTKNYADYLLVNSRSRDYTRDITFFLGPTNSGKSYEAFNMLVEGDNGVYLAPLRLLALEGKDEVVKRGKPCNLLTGEEEELMDGACFSAQTIETIDLDRHYEVAVIDEIQMMEDASRGWAWTQAFAGLNAKKLILTGSGNALPLVEAIARKLGDRLTIIEKERKNPLVWTSKPFNKSMKFKEGTAIIAFTRKKILEIRDELVQRGNKVAVVYGALSPETRRLEAQRFRSGESPILISTDAIGMGLNLPISQVLFSQSSKFDGTTRRDLNPAEVSQIGGRAGRFGLKDHEEGLVGYVTGFCPHLEPDVLRDAFAKAVKGLDDVKCGYVVPSFAQVLEAKNIFYDKSLSMILKIIATNLEFSEDWVVLCHDKMEDMIEKTKAIEEQFAKSSDNLLQKMPFQKLWKLISAPCDLELLRDYFVNLCSAVIAGTEPLYPNLPKLPITKQSLERAEFTIKQLTIYSWFARRFMGHIPPGIDKEKDPGRLLAIEENGLFEPVERTDEDREMLSHAISKAIRDERRLAPGFSGGPR